MPRADAARRIAEHVARVQHPLVLLTAPYGSESTALIIQAGERIGIRFAPCPTTPVTGGVLQRRLSILDEEPGVSVHEAAHRLTPPGAGSPPGPDADSTAAEPAVLFIKNVELLDEESSAVVDAVLREQRVGLIMSCASESRLGFRYSKALSGPRGLTVRLPEPSETERRELFTEALGAEPTSVLAEYLQATTSCPEGLRTAAALGLAEQWIGTRATHSALRHAPSWMDRHSAASVLAGLKSDLGEAGVGILQHAALQEQTPLRDFTTDPETRDAVFWMIDAGLLSVTGSQVQLGWPLLRHSLVLAAPITAPAVKSPPPETASGVLHRLANGEDLDSSAVVRAAAAHLERGLLEQARFIASTLPEGDPRRHCVAASAMTAAGACRTGLDTLAKVPECPDAAALREFIHAGLLFSPDPSSEALGDLSARLHRFSDYQPQPYLDTFPAPPASPDQDHDAPSREATQLIDVERLASCGGAALDAYAAALNDDRKRAHSSWLIATSTPVAELPIVAAGWVIERAGMAKMLYDPDAELYPTRWFEGETPERRLRYALIIQTQGMLRKLICGVEAEQLHQEMEDLWEQFEAGLPLGSASRRFMEALDYAIGGARTTDLKGPPGVLPPGLTSTFRDATIDAVLLLARLLHVPDSGLPQALEKAFQNTARTPGTRRITLRCLLLRRAAQVPPELLTLTLDYARRAGVNDMILRAAAQLGGTDAERGRVLEAPIPGLSGARFCSGPRVQPAGQSGPLETRAADPLSRREREVAHHLMLGAGAAHVARELNISVRTVQTHVRNIYRKLGVNSRTQLHARLVAVPAAPQAPAPVSTRTTGVPAWKAAR